MKRYFVALPLVMSLLSSTATARTIIEVYPSFSPEKNPITLVGQTRSAEMLAQSKVRVLENTFLELDELKAIIESLRLEEVIKDRQIEELQRDLRLASGKKPEITQNLIETMVRIESYNQYQSTRGSGTIISADGLILTNAHVVATDDGEAYPYLQICLTKNPKIAPTVECYTGEIIDYVFDYEYINSADIALVKIIDAPKLNYLNIIDNAAQIDVENITEPVTALGYPSQAGETLTVLQGRVAGFSGGFEYENEAYAGYIKTDIVLDKGISGGAVVDVMNHFVGIPSASTEHYGFVIPVEDIMDFISETAAKNKVILTDSALSLP